MKYLHLIIALFCTTLILPLNSVLAQDGEKEGDAAQGGDAGGAAPAEGGGDTAAGGGDAAPAAAPAPAAGGDGGGDAAAAPAAPAPAAGGQTAAAPAAPAPAAPAPAPAPAFDMGAAVQTAAAAPPPAAAVSESNSIVTFVQAASLSGGGDSISINDATSLFSDLGGTQGLKDLALGDNGNFADLGASIKASVVMIKRAEADGTDLKTALKKVKEFKEEVLKDSTKDFKSIAQNIAVTKLSEAKNADFDLDDPEAFVGTIQIAVASGGSLNDAIKKANNLSDEAKKNAAGKSSNTLKKTVAYAGGLDNFNEDKFKAGNDAADSGTSLDDLAKAVLLDINGKTVLERDGNRIIWSDLSKGAEFFIVTSADDDTTYSDSPELTRIKIANGKISVTDTEEAALSVAELTAKSFDFESEYAEAWTDPVNRIRDSVIEMSYTDTEYNENGEEYEYSGKAWVKVFDVEGQLFPFYVEFVPNDHPDLIDGDSDVYSEDLYSTALLDKLNAVSSLKDIPSEFDVFNRNGYEDYEDFLEDFIEDGIDSDQFIGSAEEARKLYTKHWNDAAQSVFKDKNGKTAFVTFQQETDQNGIQDKDIHFNLDLEGVVVSVIDTKRERYNGPEIYNPNTGNIIHPSDYISEEPIITTYTFGKSTITWTEDGETKTGTYSVLGEGILRVLESDGVTLTYINAFEINDYDSTNGNIKLRFYTVEEDEEFDMDEYENFRYGWHTYNYDQGSVSFVFTSVSAAESSNVYSTLTNQWLSSPFNSDYDTSYSIKDGSNLDTATSDWSDNDIKVLEEYIENLYQDTNLVSKVEMDEAINFIEWALTNRTIVDGDDFSTSKKFDPKDGGFKDPETIDYGVHQLRRILDIATNVHAIGDSDDDNKIQVQTLLNALKDSSRGELSSVTDESGNPVAISSFGNLIDDLIGNERGRVDDLENNRENDLDAILDIDGDNKGKTFNLDDVNMRILSGHTNKLSGTVTDDDPNEEAVDLTVIASGRDTIILDDLTIAADDSSKEDAYVIASADELYLRGEWNADNHDAFYASDDNDLDIEVQHASLGLASVDAMNLVNVDITTGGSLAIASLDEVNIWATDNADPNLFEVGADMDDDFEGLFIYAQNLIDIHGLNISGRVDDIYMEAYTINLENVVFPASASVLLRSELGGLNILNDSGVFRKGDVNLNNVRHMGVDSGNILTNSHFNATDTGFHTDYVEGRNRPHIQVESYKN